MNALTLSDRTFPKFVAVTAMHEEDEMQKGRMSLFVIINDVVDFVPSGPCCELLTCLTVNIAVCGSWSRRVEYLERVYIAGSSSSRSALICSAQVRTLPHSQQRPSSKVLGFWQPSRSRKLFFSFYSCRSSFVILRPVLLP